ncbi:hypothetical protein ABZV93_27530 [Actinopolymorpha sp. NPDC004070]|uniref:hypothetical protein n=1 Tax=Actinopolymorpha sp. NPDC004070 TaxID=3154548 RepID=UPI0033A0D533
MLVSSVWRERSRWWFSAGLLAGGLTSAVVAVALGLLVRPVVRPVPAAVAVVAVAVLVGLNEFGLLRLRLPQNGRQVPESIGDDGPRYGALHFGFEMGTGVRTYMTTGLPHVLVLAVALCATWPQGLAAGLAFGAGRAAMVLARHAHRDDGHWDGRLAAYDRTLRLLLTFACCCVLAVVLLAATGTG